jgi:hypothetical protein
MDLETARKEGEVRRYDVCADHDADYFGRRRHLTVEQWERIRVDLAPRFESAMT